MGNYQNSYVHGSLAYKYDETHYAEENKKKKVLVRRANKELLAHRINLVVSIMIVFGMTVGLMTQYSSVTMKQDNLKKMERELKLVQDSLCDEKVEIAETINTENIQKVATERLGMVKAADYQIINIDIPIENYTVKY